jgi:hypothetical protein
MSRRVPVEVVHRSTRDAKVDGLDSAHRPECVNRKFSGFTSRVNVVTVEWEIVRRIRARCEPLRRCPAPLLLNSVRAQPSVWSVEGTRDKLQ